MSGTTPPPAPTRFGAPEFLLLLTVGLVWGAAYIFIRQGLVLGATPIAYAAARYALSAGAFAALALARREAWPERPRLVVSAVVGGIMVIGLYGGFLYWGEQYTTGGYAAVLAAGAPLLTVAFGFLLLQGERLGPLGIAGIAVGFGGTAVIVLPDLTSRALGSWQGPAFVLAAMTITTAGTVLLRRFGGGRQGLWQIGAQFAVAALLLGGAALVLPTPEALPPTAGVWAGLVALVVLSSVIGYFAYFALHHRVGPIRANVVAYLIPVVGVGIGTGVLGEPFTAFEVAGVAVTLLGVTLVLWETGRRSAKPP